MAYCETKTGAINKELFEMATMVRKDTGLAALLDQKTSREIIESKSLQEFPEFHIRFTRFLRDHGHREMDFDAYVPTWIECPWVVLDSLRLILQTPMNETPAEKERALKIRMQQAEFDLFKQLPADLHFFFYEIIRLARIYTSLDDLEHYETTRLTLSLRRGLKELGNRLVQRRVLEEPMDIFFGRITQISEAVCQNHEEGWNAFGNTVRNQKEAYLRAQARRPEWALGENQPSITPAGSFLGGLAGSPGQAEGEVFQVVSSDDFATFPKGAVLVARTTNPTWTPLFYSAAAVITESGGPLSHGAVTAREMRIPAVMSVKDCLSRLKNGQRVRVDGTSGKIYLV